MMKKRYIAFLLILSIFLLGLLLPEKLTIPVKNAKTTDWNHKTFWYEPWGRSGVHKGIDIFAKKGTDLIAATSGMVIFKGNLKLGGHVLAVLGPKWRVHYYAHLDSSSVAIGEWVSQSKVIGTVGDSGNAKGKPAHVHYSIVTLLPYPWRWDGSTQGWKKMFYLNPSEMLLNP